MNKAWDRIKREFDEKPLQTIAVVALAVQAASKLLDVTTVAKWRRAYAKQVDYRVNTKQ